MRMDAHNPLTTAAIAVIVPVDALFPCAVKTPALTEDVRLMVRATNNDGAGQLTHHWNRSGFMRCVIEDVRVRIV